MLYHEHPSDGVLQLVMWTAIYGIGAMVGDGAIGLIFKFAGAVGTVAVAFNGLYQMRKNILEYLRDRKKNQRNEKTNKGPRQMGK